MHKREVKMHQIIEKTRKRDIVDAKAIVIQIWYKSKQINVSTPSI